MVLQRVATSAFSHEVLYIGSAIPLETSEGLEAVQQPLRHRYPVNSDDNIQGMMARIEVKDEGIELKFKDDKNQVIMFPYTALTLCAAVRCVKVADPKTKEIKPRFVSLTSPEAGGVNSEKPAIFTAINRRTKGRQVLECHGFITMHPKDAMDLVRWVSQFNRNSKQEGTTSFNNGVASPASAEFPSSEALEMSTTQSAINFGPDESYPVQLTPGAAIEATAGPSFYEEPPEHGYFYTTKTAGVKKYSLQKMTSGGVADTIETRSVIGPGSVLNGPDESFTLGTEMIDGPPRGYAGSTVSAPAYHLPPRPPFMIPVRRPAPVLVRPVVYGPPPVVYGYPPPPPDMMRAHPVPVMIPGPPPGGYYPAPPRRRGSHGSSDGSSSPGSPPSPPMKTKSPKKKVREVSNGNEPSDEGSRPGTPPTDYEARRGLRVSRREDHLTQRSWNRRSVSPTLSAPLYHSYHGRRSHQSDHHSHHNHQSGHHNHQSGHQSHHNHQSGYNMAQPWMIYQGSRTKSVPPGSERGMEKKSKKKSKKEKKKGKSGKENSTFREYDESAHSMGYQSDLGPNALPFRRFQNQFQHERAFSKSLAEEIKRSDGSLGRNAYNLNSGGQQSEGPLF